MIEGLVFFFSYLETFIFSYSLIDKIKWLELKK